MGYATDGRRLLLSRPVPVTEEILSLHHAEYYLRLLAERGVPRPEAPRLLLRVTGEERESMRSRLAGLGVPEGRRIVGINPGATYGSAKRWFPDRFAQVADTLSEEWDAAVVLMGSASEAPLSAEIEATMGRKAVNLAGRTTVREMMALLSSCSFLVTNDSEPMHIGAAVGVPMVTIFGPTDWRKTSPWTDRAKIVRVDVDCSPCHRREGDRGHECMLVVTAGMVVAAARGLLGGRPATARAGSPPSPPTPGETPGGGSGPASRAPRCDTGSTGRGCGRSRISFSPTGRSPCSRRTATSAKNTCGSWPPRSAAGSTSVRLRWTSRPLPGRRNSRGAPCGNSRPARRRPRACSPG